jgi:energy-coupling factor transporter ATP-binding protein EcfA2
MFKDYCQTEHLVLGLYAKQLTEIKIAIHAGRSVLVIGEMGSGKTTLARRLLGEISGLNTAIASYDGSSKQALIDIAEGLEIPTTNAKGKNLTSDALKEKILGESDERTLIVCDNVHRWPASLRYWLERLYAKGVILLFLSMVNVRKDIFLRVIKIKLPKPTEAEIRDIMITEAILLGYDMTMQKLSHLQQFAGSNPLLAKKVVGEAQCGRYEQDGEHTRYINVAPMVNTLIVIVAMVKLAAAGFDDTTLYVIGGLMVMLMISGRYICYAIGQTFDRK